MLNVTFTQLILIDKGELLNQSRYLIDTSCTLGVLLSYTKSLKGVILRTVRYQAR